MMVNWDKNLNLLFHTEKRSQDILGFFPCHLGSTSRRSSVKTKTSKRQLLYDLKCDFGQEHDIFDLFLRNFKKSLLYAVVKFYFVFHSDPQNVQNLSRRWFLSIFIFCFCFFSCMFLNCKNCKLLWKNSSLPEIMLLWILSPSKYFGSIASRISMSWVNLSVSPTTRNFCSALIFAILSASSDGSSQMGISPQK